MRISGSASVRLQDWRLRRRLLLPFWGRHLGRLRWFRLILLYMVQNVKTRLTQMTQLPVRTTTLPFKLLANSEFGVKREISVFVFRIHWYQSWKTNVDFFLNPLCDNYRNSFTPRQRSSTKAANIVKVVERSVVGERNCRDSRPWMWAISSSFYPQIESIKIRREGRESISGTPASGSSKRSNRLQNNIISLLPGAQDAGRLTWRSPPEILHHSQNSRTYPAADLKPSI